MKYILSCFLTLLFLQNNQAQVIGDALRYGFTETTGTARTLGLGGSISAIGADFSTVSKNPAGLGWYRKSELVMTPSLTLTKTTSDLEGGDVRDRNRSNINFNNFGFVIKGRERNRTTRLRSLNFAFGYNRIADFHADNNFAGTTPGSITDRFLELSQGLTPNQLDAFEGGLAFDTGAILQSSDDTYFSDFLPGEPVEKNQINLATGGINEFTLSMAANYDERFLVGATVGIPVVNYRENKTYRENDEDDSTPFFEQLRFTEGLTQTGAGINVKVGAIYRATQAVRIGAAIHSPTSYALNDVFTTRLSYTFNEGNGAQTFEAESPTGEFEYRVVTPTVLIGSAAFIIGKMGLLTAEVQYQDYSALKFNFNQTDNAADLDYEAELNRQIDETYKSAVNIRLGGEFAYEKLRVRAGYSLIGSPYVEGDSFYGSYSAGIGLRNANFYADLGYRFSTFGETYVPYVTFDQDVNPQQTVDNVIDRNTFLLTFGFRF